MAACVTLIMVVIADQISKLWIRRAIDLESAVPIIPGFFNITYVRNRGGAFGIFPQQQYLFVILSVVTVLAIIFFYRRHAPRSKPGRIATGLILGGAIGNLIDRMVIDGDGCVIDWLDLHLGAYHWPAFNIADSSITAGVFLLIFLMSVKPQRDGGRI